MIIVNLKENHPENEYITSYTYIARVAQ